MSHRIAHALTTAALAACGASTPAPAPSPAPARQAPPAPAVDEPPRPAAPPTYAEIAAIDPSFLARWDGRGPVYFDPHGSPVTVDRSRREMWADQLQGWAREYEGKVAVFVEGAADSRFVLYLDEESLVPYTLRRTLVRFDRDDVGTPLREDAAALELAPATSVEVTTGWDDDVVRIAAAYRVPLSGYAARDDLGRMFFDIQTIAGVIVPRRGDTEPLLGDREPTHVLAKRTLVRTRPGERIFAITTRARPVAIVAERGDDALIQWTVALEPWTIRGWVARGQLAPGGAAPSSGFGYGRVHSGILEEAEPPRPDETLLYATPGGREVGASTDPGALEVTETRDGWARVEVVTAIGVLEVWRRDANTAKFTD